MYLDYTHKLKLRTQKLNSFVKLKKKQKQLNQNIARVLIMKEQIRAFFKPPEKQTQVQYKTSN